MRAMVLTEPAAGELEACERELPSRCRASC